MKEAVSLYEKASSAQVKWANVGGWRGEAVPSQPDGLEWRKKGLKVFGDGFGYKQL